LIVELRPEQLNPNSFQVHFEFRYDNQVAAIALIRHLAINAQTRQRCALPEGIARWLEASNLGRIGSI
jgi:1,4-dihydroxy-2-naphthoyl-CoA hydrolase